MKKYNILRGTEVSVFYEVNHAGETFSTVHGICKNALQARKRQNCIVHSQCGYTVAVANIVTIRDNIVTSNDAGITAGGPVVTPALSTSGWLIFALLLGGAALLLRRRAARLR